MKRVAILVTGSREWTDAVAVRRAFHSHVPWNVPAENIVVLHGDARGADSLAADHALHSNMIVLPMPAPWDRFKRLGKTALAGKLRNRMMVLVLRCLRWCGYYCMVLAFPMPSSRGTLHCMDMARRAGFEVTVVEPGGER